MAGLLVAAVVAMVRPPHLRPRAGAGGFAAGDAVELDGDTGDGGDCDYTHNYSAAGSVAEAPRQGERAAVP